MSSVRITKDSMTVSLARIESRLPEILQDAYDAWFRATPVRTGNARSRTRLSGNRILADYPYAVPLDQGRSRQSPQGMSRPAERAIALAVRRILRK